jgi:hypothetical protein
MNEKMIKEKKRKENNYIVVLIEIKNSRSNYVFIFFGEKICIFLSSLFMVAFACSRAWLIIHFLNQL